MPLFRSEINDTKQCQGVNFIISYLFDNMKEKKKVKPDFAVNYAGEELMKKKR